MFVRYLLVAVFFIAVFVRFLYYPDNIYFGFDQARDAYISQEVARGDLKIVGPPTAISGVNHGPLYYYIFGPIYLISQGDPSGISAFLRIYNALGVFLVFLIGLIIFNRYVGLIAALIYALSFEQTQFAIYLNHPSLAVNTVLLFYLGLSILIFKKEAYGFLLAILGLALSIQFEFPLIYLVVVLSLILLVFISDIKILKAKDILWSALLFASVLSTFILSELKFSFRTTHIIFTDLLFNHATQKVDYLRNINIIGMRFLSDNLIAYEKIWGLSYLTLFLSTINLYLKNRITKKQLLFLIIWFSGGFIPYLGNTSHLPLYYYGIAASISLIILASFLIQAIWLKMRTLGILLVLIIITSNCYLITLHNPNGSIPTINVQSGMILKNQKRAIDYIYTQSAGEEFSINALSMPLYINTVWSYLFEWYGKSKYGYLPVWGGELAQGYPGKIVHISSRSTLPIKKYLILEPTRGISPQIIKSFMDTEDLFTHASKEVRFGQIFIQTRVNR